MTARRWRKTGPLRFAAVLALAASGAHAQVKINDGEIAGSVRDTTHGAIANAKVTAIDDGRGIRITADTTADGRYRLTLLPPGLYQVTFEAIGFTDRTASGVEVSVGSATRLDMTLSVEAQQFSVTVNAETPAIDAERTQQATLIDTTRIENLPINRRNYLDFVLLSPGVVDTTNLADSTDFRVPSTPTSNLGFSGSTGRGNTFSVDGIENNGSVGSVRPSLSQDAVQEFQVNRANYSVEYGGAYGAAVNIVSKSGANMFHGALFTFLRDRNLEARNFFDPGKSAYTRVQAGASAGGPIKHDRTFFFAAIEGLDLHQTVFVPILETPGVLSQLSTSQQQLLSDLRASGQGYLASALGAALTPSDNPRVVNLFQTNSGVFPLGSYSTQASLRVDHRVSDRQNIFVRANGTDESDSNTQFGGQQGLSRGLFTKDRDAGMAAQDIFRINPSWTSVTRLGYGSDRYTVLPNDPIGPAIDISGYGSFGRNLQAPSDQTDRHYQAQEILNYSAGRHAIKFGMDLNPVHNDSNPQVFFGGRFIFSEAFPVSQIVDGIAGAGYAEELAAGSPALAAILSEPISSLQAYSLGLPVAYIQGFGNPRQTSWERRYSGFVEDSFRPMLNLTLTAGLRYSYEGNQYIQPENRLAPRFGFAWTPANRSDWVVRGGFGIFQSNIDFYASYSGYALKRPDLSLVVVPVTGVPVTDPMTGQPLNSIDIYQGLLGEGIIGQRTVTYSDLAQFGIPAGFRFPVTGGLSSDFRNPYSEQLSFEVEHSIGSTAFSAAYNWNRGLHMPRTLDANIYQAGIQPDGWPIIGVVNPNLANNYIMSSTANSYYNALVLQVNRRFLRHWALNAHYTWSHSIDDVTDYDQDFMPQNQFDARADRATSPFNRTQRLVASAVAQSPAGTRRGAGWKANLLHDWTASTIVQAMSAQPFNVLTGYDDVGDGQANTHRPLGLGRDAGIGPDFFTVDMRLARTFRVWGERAHASFTVEAFNLLNHTNFESVNNVVGAIPLSALPHPLVGHTGDPTQPLAFTSAYDPRQIQLGLRIAF